MSVEENKELVRRYFDQRWNHGNFDICDEMLAPPMDSQAQKTWGLNFYNTFGGDMQLTVRDILAEGDQVMIHWENSGTHQGEYLGVSATGKQVTLEGIALLRIADGKIVSDVPYWDNLSILQQLGAAPQT